MSKRRLLTSSSLTATGTIEHLILLDLLGAPDPLVHNSLLDTAWLFDAMRSSERRLGESGAFMYGGDGGTRWTSYFVPRTEGMKNWYIEDDHLPFLERGVSVLHIIALPYPAVWHTLQVGGRLCLVEMRTVLIYCSCMVFRRILMFRTMLRR